MSTVSPVLGAVGGRAARGEVLQAARVESPAAGGVATLEFLTGWREILSGPILQGGTLSVRYDPDRTRACRRYHNGLPAWFLFGHVRFSPSGQSHEGALVESFDGLSGRVFDPPRAVPLDVPVPLDATGVELWFQNTDLEMCSAWDSRFGQNYRYDVTPQGPTRPVIPRAGAVPSLEMVNVFGSSASKANVFPAETSGPRQGTDLQTFLSVSAWVSNVAYAKNVWVDVHVFDGDDNLIQAETLALGWAGSAGGHGDFFAYGGKVYQGSTATPGSVSPKPDARKVQYRLYYEVNGRVFTDAILHQHEVQENAATL
jgi:hypothetical protein